MRKRKRSARSTNIQNLVHHLKSRDAEAEAVSQVDRHLQPEQHFEHLELEHHIEIYLLWLAFRCGGADLGVGLWTGPPFADAGTDSALISATE